MAKKNKKEVELPDREALESLATEMNEVMGLDPKIKFNRKTSDEELIEMIKENAVDDGEPCIYHSDFEEDEDDPDKDVFTDEAKETLEALEIEIGEEPEPEAEPEPEEKEEKKPSKKGKKEEKEEKKPAGKKGKKEEPEVVEDEEPTWESLHAMGDDELSEFIENSDHKKVKKLDADDFNDAEALADKICELLDLEAPKKSSKKDKAEKEEKPAEKKDKKENKKEEKGEKKKREKGNKVTRYMAVAAVLKEGKALTEEQLAEKADAYYAKNNGGNSGIAQSERIVDRALQLLRALELVEEKSGKIKYTGE